MCITEANGYSIGNIHPLDSNEQMKKYLLKNIQGFYFGFYQIGSLRTELNLMNDNTHYFIIVEKYLENILGPKAAHHLVLRYCHINCIGLEELRPQHLPDLSKFLKKNLEFFAGKDRAKSVSKSLSMIVSSEHSKHGHPLPVGI